MRNIMKYAMSRGETPKEFCDYCWTRTHYNQRCTDGTTLKDAVKIYSDPFYQPPYITEWFQKRELRLKHNGHQHTELP